MNNMQEHARKLSAVREKYNLPVLRQPEQTINENSELSTRRISEDDVSEDRLSLDR